MDSLTAAVALLAAHRQEWERALAAQRRTLELVRGRYAADILRAVAVANKYASQALSIIAEAERSRDRHRQYAAVMLALGWPPVLDIYPEQVNEILARFDSSNPIALAAEVSEFLVAFFDEGKLSGKLDEWRRVRWVDARIPILQKVIEAHIRGDYELSVPAMLPQIEGVVASGFAYAGWMNGKALDGLYDRLLAAEEGNITDAAFRQYIDVVYLSGFEHGAALGSSFSRHAILHGADLDYGTAENSLRAVLLFDHLVRSFRLISLDGSRVVHMPDCAYVRRSTAARTVFPRMAAATSAGRVPCRSCRPDERQFL